MGALNGDLGAAMAYTDLKIAQINPFSQIYGYKIDESNSNVETAVSYLLNSVGKTPATKIEKVNKFYTFT